MQFQKRTLRGVLLLTVATLFFVGLYTLADIPSTYSHIDYKLIEPNSSIDLDKTIDSVLIDGKYDCQRYYRTYYESSESPPSDKLVLYQPPCPLGTQLPDFRFLMNQDVCASGVGGGGGGAGSDVYMLVLVGSHPSHRRLRDVIRRTWGSPNITGFPFRLAFLFGQMPSAQLQSELDTENRAHRDLIQGSFEDSYRNVGVRDLMGLRWAWQYCNQARFVMRADDDISLDIYGLVDVLQRRFDAGATASGGAATGSSTSSDNATVAVARGGNQRTPFTDFVGCFQMMVDTPVLRTGRYAVSELEHPGAIYAPYCQGWMYILTPQMAFKLDVAAMGVPAYWLNDAFITGTLLEALGKVPLNLEVNYTISVNEMRAMQYRDANLPPTYTVGPTDADTRLTQVLHDKYKRFALLHGLPRTRWIPARSRSTTNSYGSRVPSVTDKPIRAARGRSRVGDSATTNEIRTT